jgi:hypothetical protein
MRANSTPSPSRSRLSLAAPLLAALLLVGCVPTQSQFQKEAGDAASTFLAAAETLRLRHEDKLIRTYVVGAFDNYRELVGGLPEDLPKADGIPAQATLERVLELHAEAMPALLAPCLDSLCEWRSQVEALEAAGKAYLAAAGG